MIVYYAFIKKLLGIDALVNLFSFAYDNKFFF